jgi:long-subunit fatty acid transport protein
MNLTILKETTTEANSVVDQLLTSSLLTDVCFSQSGSIDAFSPAFAVDVTPWFSLGVAMNIYVDGASRGNRIESEMIANYEGVSDSYAEVTDTQVSTNWFFWTLKQVAGTSHGETSASHTNEETTVQEEIYTVEGQYREDNITDQFYGFNATIGALWVVSDKLTLGASVDLPWTGRGEQTKRINHQVFTYNSNQVQVAESSSQTVQKRDVEYTFPLYWAVGGLWRWNDRFYTSVDVSCTHWSQYSYKAEGEERINPLNGEPHSSSALDDCWSVRCGGEYLCMLSWTEIPLRGGLFWEQRPAIGSPDEYWGFSLGSGISLGKEPGRMILDIAYTFERGENVMGSLLPEQGTASDVNKHQLFISAIWHF